MQCLWLKLYVMSILFVYRGMSIWGRSLWTKFLKGISLAYMDRDKLLASSCHSAVSERTPCCVRSAKRDSTKDVSWMFIQLQSIIFTIIRSWNFLTWTWFRLLSRLWCTLACYWGIWGRLLIFPKILVMLVKAFTSLSQVRKPCTP